MGGLYEHSNKYRGLYTVKVVSCPTPPCQTYPYFDVVVGLAWSKDPESYAGGNTSSDRGSRAGKVKGNDPDKKGHPGPPGWGLSMWLTTPTL
jgi:hypothetical protein